MERIRYLLAREGYSQVKYLSSDGLTENYMAAPSGSRIFSHVEVWQNTGSVYVDGKAVGNIRRVQRFRGELVYK